MRTQTDDARHELYRAVKAQRQLPLEAPEPPAARVPTTKTCPKCARGQMAVTGVVRAAEGNLAVVFRRCNGCDFVRTTLEEQR